MHDSVVHRLHPLARLIVTFVFVVVVVSFNRYRPLALLPMLLYPALMMAFSGTPLGPILRRMLLMLPLPLCLAATNLFFDTSVVTCCGHDISGGIASGITLLVKTMLTVWAVLVLMATTTLPALATSMRRLRIPSAFVLQFLLTSRYLGVLMEEAAAMVTARRLRAAGRRTLTLRETGPFLGSLLLRSLDRAERIYLAMRCRGFRGEYHAASTPPFRAADLVFLLATTVPMILLRWFI